MGLGVALEFVAALVAGPDDVGTDVTEFILLWLVVSGARLMVESGTLMVTE